MDIALMRKLATIPLTAARSLPRTTLARRHRVPMLAFVRFRTEFARAEVTSWPHAPRSVSRGDVFTCHGRVGAARGGRGPCATHAPRRLAHCRPLPDRFALDGQVEQAANAVGVEVDAGVGLARCVNQ